MSVDILYPAGAIILGIVAATITFVVLARVSNKITTYFQLFPESKGVLSLSLRLVTWGLSAIVFMLFLRFALQMMELNFTMAVVEALILEAPKYILAVVLVVAGFYVSRMVKEKSATYPFREKNRVLLVADLIIHMTFFFTALAVIGIDTSFFIIFYIFALAVIGFIVALTVGLSIGIPLGIGLYNRLRRRGDRRKRRRLSRKRQPQRPASPMARAQPKRNIFIRQRPLRLHDEYEESRNNVCGAGGGDIFAWLHCSCPRHECPCRG